ncbi:MAG: N-acetylmuramoyl-L-alanine amidase [Bacteroidetes bacterium]|nr:N-acetylmuramoyl-L-alanine amidase [Bacteroidota bacterium]
MRNIKYIVVHCTATQPTATVEAIKKYWKGVRKWDKPGYHYLILRDGEIVQLLEEKEISYGAYGHNHDCIHIAYIGGIDKEGKPVDNRSARQIHAMFDKLVELSNRYRSAEILGHRDFPDVNKACPSFDVKEWLKNYEPEFKQAA